MKNFKEDLPYIKAIILDVDGVLSLDTMTLHHSGVPLRTVNIKDGYALQLAVKMGIYVAIITGGNAESTLIRYHALGITDIFMGVRDKVIVFRNILKEKNLKPDQVMYMGDDIPDLAIMKEVGMPVCPADAVPEILSAARYVSSRNGGCGCVRDVLEQVLKAQHKWTNGEAVG